VVLISVRGCVDPRAIVGLKELGQLNKRLTALWVSRPVAEYLYLQGVKGRESFFSIYGNATKKIGLCCVWPI
jgi:hypothetical protein